MTMLVLLLVIFLVFGAVTLVMGFYGLVIVAKRLIELHKRLFGLLY